MANKSKNHRSYVEKIRQKHSRSNSIYSGKILENEMNDTIFYQELDIRAKALQELNFFENILEYTITLDGNSTETDIDECLNIACKYLFIIEVEHQNYHFENLKEYFSLKTISLRELLGLNKRFLLTKKQFDILTDTDMKYQHNMTTTLLYNEMSNEQFYYYEILDDIYDYFINSNEEFEKFCLNEYGEIIENKTRYLKLYIDEKVNEISLDIQEVIIYLEKAGFLNYYRDILISYFRLTNPIPTIKNNRLAHDLSKYYYPNKIINYQFNLNDSLDIILDDIQKLHQEFVSNELTDLDLLYKTIREC